MVLYSCVVEVLVLVCPTFVFIIFVFMCCADWELGALFKNFMNAFSFFPAPWGIRLNWLIIQMHLLL